MSSKLTHRVEAQQKMKKKKKHEVELKKAQQAAEEKEKEKAAAEAVKPREETLVRSIIKLRSKGTLS